MPKKIYKVIQGSSGNVGKASIRGICNRSDLELVGLIVSNEKKNGLDAGTLSEIDEIGVLASTNIEEVLSLDADCVNYTPLASLRLGDDPDADKNNILSLLRRGFNVVTTVGFLYPKAFGKDFEKEIDDACLEGGSSLHGTGIAPGWLSDLVPLTMSGMSEEISEVRVTESSEFSYYPSEEIVFDTMLMGKSLEQYEQESVRYENWISGLFSEAIYLIADGIGSNIINIEKSIDIITSKKDVEIAAGTVKEGKISGQRRKWVGHCDNNVQIIQEAIWRAYPDAAPDWDEPVGMCVEVKGKPNMKIDFAHDWNSDPLVSTALHGVHAIPMVCDASPGFKSFLDLPLISSKFN
jgi:hypothetical protein